MWLPMLVPLSFQTPTVSSEHCYEGPPTSRRCLFFPSGPSVPRDQSLSWTLCPVWGSSGLDLCQGLWSSGFTLSEFPDWTGSINENKNSRTNCHGTLDYEPCKPLPVQSLLHPHESAYFPSRWLRQPQLAFWSAAVCNAVLGVKRTHVPLRPFFKSQLSLYFIGIFPNVYFILLKSYSIKFLVFEEQVISLLFQLFMTGCSHVCSHLMSSTHRSEFASVGTHSGTTIKIPFNFVMLFFLSQIKILFLIFVKKNLYCVCLRGCAWMLIWTPKGKKRWSAPLELLLHVSVSHSRWVEPNSGGLQ